MSVTAKLNYIIYLAAIDPVLSYYFFVLLLKLVYPEKKTVLKIIDVIKLLLFSRIGLIGCECLSGKGVSRNIQSIIRLVCCQKKKFR